MEDMRLGLHVDDVSKEMAKRRSGSKVFSVPLGLKGHSYGGTVVVLFKRLNCWVFTRVLWVTSPQCLLL